MTSRPLSSRLSNGMKSPHTPAATSRPRSIRSNASFTSNYGTNMFSPIASGSSTMSGRSPRPNSIFHARRPSDAIPLGLAVGARVFLPNTKCFGTVRHLGDTEFSKSSSEVWVGVELDSPKGKNAGEVQGKKYFDCQPLHGIFVRPGSCIVLLDERRQEDVPPPTPSHPVRQDVEDLQISSSSRRASLKMYDTPVPVMPPAPPFSPPPYLSSSSSKVYDSGREAQASNASPPPTELQSSLLEEKWLVDLLVELVTQSEMLQGKLSEQVKEEVALQKREDKAAPALKALGDKLERQVATELRSLTDSVERRLNAVEDQIGAALGKVLDDSRNGPDNEQQQHHQMQVLQNIANAAKLAKTNLLHDLDERKKRFQRIHMMNIEESIEKEDSVEQQLA